MAKLLKYTGITLGVLLIVIIGVVTAIVVTFDPNEHKATITQTVKEATGRDLIIDGDIGLSVFPWLGLELGKVTLSNAPGFGQNAFAAIEKAEVNLKIKPLLFEQKIEMQTITLHGLNMNLQISQDGTTNWDDLAQSGTTGETAAPPKVTPPKDKQAQPAPGEQKAPLDALAGLAIGGLDLSNATVSFDDRATGSRYKIEALNLTTGPITLDAPLDINFSARFNSNAPKVSGDINLKTRLIADLKGMQKHTLEGTTLAINFDSSEFGIKGNATLASDIDVDLGTERYSLKGTQLNADVRGADLPGGSATLKLNTDIQADLKKQTAALKGLQIDTYTINLSGDINATDILSAPALNGTLDIKEFSPRELMKAMALDIPETSDPKALTRASVRLALASEGTRYSIDNLIVKLDDSTLKGKLQADLAPEYTIPALSYDLSLNKINVDRYLPPVTEGDAKAAATPAAAGAAAATLPMETLRALNIKGGFNIGKLQVSGLHLSELTTQVNAKDGVIDLSPLSAKLYQGHYNGNMRLNARGKRPAFKLNESLKGIHAGPLLKDLLGEAPISGVANIEAVLTAKGHDPKTMTRTLNGTIKTSFENGAVTGINVPAELRKLKAKIRREPPPKDGQHKSTDFSTLSASFKIKKGVAHNDDLYAKVPFGRITGKGSANLVKETMDYTVTAKVVGTSKGQGGGEFNELKGLALAIRATGPFTDPKLDPQIDETFKAWVAQKKKNIKKTLAPKKAAAKKKLDEKKDELKDELKNRLLNR